MLLRVRLENARNLAKKRGPLARVVRWVVGLLLAFEIFYVAAANIGLQLGGLQLLFGSTDTVSADFHRAWTIWPGVLHVENLKLVIADQNIQCLVSLERVVLNLRLVELPKKVFHATKLRGSGLVLRFRNRVQPEDARKPYVSALPPIPGFDDPPLYEPTAKSPPIPEDKYNLWTVHLEDVDVGVDELWAEEFRYVGHARARGSFRLKPARNLWVGPGATLDLDPGRLLGGNATPFLDDFHGHIDTTVHFFDVRKPEGREVLRNISTELVLDGRIVGLEPARWFADPAADLRVDQQGGRVSVRVGVDHGVAKPGSHVDIAGDALTVRQKELRFDATAPWSVVGAADETGPGANVKVRFSRASIGGHAIDGAPPMPEGAAPIAVEDAQIVVSSTSRDTAGEWELAGGSLDVGRATAPELIELNSLAPALPMRFESGSGELAGHVTYRDDVLTGEGRAKVTRAVAHASGEELRGSVELSGKVRRADLQKRTYDFDVDLHAQDASVADRDPHRCTTTSVGEAKLGAALRIAPGVPASGSVDGTLTHVSWHSGASTFSGDAVVHAATERNDERKEVLRTVARFRSPKAGGGDKSRWEATAKGLVVDSVLDWGKGPVGGSVRVVASGVAGKIGETRLNADVTADVLLASIDRAAQNGEIQGSVRVRHASLAKGDRHVEDWWAILNVDRTRFSMKNNVDFDGSMSASFKDGLPGLLALSEGDEIPGWLPAMLPLHGLSGKMSVHRRCRILDVTIPEISGGPIMATGKISSQPDELRGAILVQLRDAPLLGAGIGLGKKSGGLSLLAGKDWLKGHLDWLRNEENSLSTAVCEEAPKESSCGRDGTSKH